MFAHAALRPWQHLATPWSECAALCSESVRESLCVYCGSTQRAYKLLISQASTTDWERLSVKLPASCESWSKSQPQWKRTENWIIFRRKKNLKSECTTFIFVRYKVIHVKLELARQVLVVLLFLKSSIASCLLYADTEPLRASRFQRQASPTSRPLEQLHHHCYE